VLEGLITSRTRIKMLLKFFTNSSSTAYLRGLADEFDESTNSIRHELNHLTKAGYLISSEKGRTIEYRANTNHPLFGEIKGLVHKYLGVDKIIDGIVKKLGDLKAAYIIGDYAVGRDSGMIEILLIGQLDKAYLDKLVKKAEKTVNRDIKTTCIGWNDFAKNKTQYGAALLLWDSVADNN
jgi:heterodisulfide reductase subunit B